MPTQSTAWVQLVTELRVLHAEAGAPSSRVLAKLVNRDGSCMSHTTVNEFMQGKRMPSWNVTERIVDALHGDTSHFRQLWSDAVIAAAPTPPSGPSNTPRTHVANTWTPTCVICAIVISQGPLNAQTFVAGDAVCADHVLLRVTSDSLVAAIQVAADDLGRTLNLPGLKTAAV